MRRNVPTPAASTIISYLFSMTYQLLECCACKTCGTLFAMLTIFRRHLASCKFRSKGRKHRNCGCQRRRRPPAPGGERDPDRRRVGVKRLALSAKLASTTPYVRWVRQYSSEQSTA